ncbi:hypothetical protein DPSP01_010358 [Paraphaeosphaeria sporulosa]
MIFLQLCPRVRLHGQNLRCTPFQQPPMQDAFSTWMSATRFAMPSFFTTIHGIPVAWTTVTGSFSCLSYGLQASGSPDIEMTMLRQFDASAWQSSAVEQRLDNPEVGDPRGTMRGNGAHIGCAQSLDDLD